jgi:hypothetical protein
MAIRFVSLSVIGAIGYLVLPAVAQAQETSPQSPTGPVITGGDYVIDPQTTSKALNTRGYSPYAGRKYPTQVFWGDEHVHTGWSADAGAAGATLGPEEALRFARGEEVVSSTGQPAKLSRPLDWVAITDHSDGAGTIFGIRDGDPQLMKSPQLKRWHELMAAGEGTKVITELVVAQSNNKLPPEIKDPTYAKDVWRKNTAIMEKYNEPGRFTAFIGYEWTSNAGGGDNLHRNVIYRDGKALADRMIPMTTFDSENPEDLWKWMATYEEKTGGSLLAIPHNGNLSNGRMFELHTFEGKPLTREWAKTRALWEPMYEITQIKGTGETHPSLSPNDEFADFELLDESNLAGVPKKSEMIATEYAREALKQGLKLEKELGVNPFKFGFAAGTDTHTGLTTAEEDNYFGKISTLEPAPHRWEHLFLDTPQVKVPSWKLSAAGWTGVWATENTREAIWDALKRREAYGSTGPRIMVRFFGSFDFTEEDANTRQPAEAGYAKGVPMGGDLQGAPQGKAPTFLVAALKDPLSGNLDRIQIIKGWMDAQGELHEKVYNVVWGDADKRKLDSNGQLPPVGNTVNVAEASWTNTIGDPELITVWKDPDFDPHLKAFYYARVIEIPTPRWTAYDAKKFDQKLPNDIPMFLQERAYTSPIWYSPKS